MEEEQKRLFYHLELKRQSTVIYLTHLPLGDVAVSLNI